MMLEKTEKERKFHPESVGRLRARSGVERRVLSCLLRR